MSREIHKRVDSLENSKTPKWVKLSALVAAVLLGVFAIHLVFGTQGMSNMKGMHMPSISGQAGP